MSTPIELLKSVYDETLVNICKSMKDSVSKDSGADLVMIKGQLKDAINKIFEGYTCVEIITTNNTDNILFGINISPTLTDADVLKIVLDSDPVQLTRYAMEIDTKICDKLEAEEIAAYIVEEIASTMSPNAIDNVRGILDVLLTNNDEVINVKQSVNYSQILTFGIKDTLKRVAGLLYRPVDEIGINDYAESFEIKDILANCREKLNPSEFDDGTNSGVPKLGVLSWVLSIYDNVSENYKLAMDTLSCSIRCTGSVLDKRELDKTMKCIRRASSEVLTEAQNSISLLETKGLSLFKSMKQNGLRGIEDDLYEFKMRLKNVEEEDEAMYILHQVNTRISILEDYLYNTPGLSEQEIAHWRSVIDAYRMLRIDLTKRKIGKNKTYGIFIDYDKLDQLDKDQDQ